MANAHKEPRSDGPGELMAPGGGTSMPSAGEPARQHRLVDVIIGVVIGAMAASNLVQGMWTESIPLLDVTAIAFAMSVPIAVIGLFQKNIGRSMGAFLLLTATMTFGYHVAGLNPSSTDKRLSIAITVVYAFLVAALALTSPRRTKVFLLTIVVFAILVFIGQVLVPDPAAAAVGRRTPLGLNAIGSGRALGAGIVVALALAVSTSERFLRRLMVLACVPLTIGLMLSASRGPVVGVLAGLAVILWSVERLARTPKVFVSLALVTVASFAYQRLNEAGSHIADLSDSGRTYLYRTAFDVAIANPFGIGWGNFYNYLNSAVIVPDQGYNQYPHNILLEVFSEGGSIAFVMFLAWLTVVWRWMYTNRKFLNGLPVNALAAFAFAGALLSSDVVGNRLVWVAFGAGTALAVAARTCRGPS